MTMADLFDNEDYKKGWDNGYRSGYETGSAREMSENKAFELGYEHGFSDGHAEGYEQGWDEGREDLCGGTQWDDGWNSAVRTVINAGRIHKVYEKENLYWCFNCHDYTNYEIKETTEECTVGGYSVKAPQSHAYCKKCGTMMYPDFLEDKNIEAMHQEYLKAKEIKE